MSETRAEKARRLVDEGSVVIDYSNDNATYAYVGHGSDLQCTALYASGSFTCTCNWGEQHNYSDDLCAHALAVKLMTEKEN